MTPRQSEQLVSKEEKLDRPTQGVSDLKELFLLTLFLFF
jgi:hypothetical protein